MYLDPWSGISGDMTLSALLDAGGPDAEETLHAAVASLGLAGVKVAVDRVTEWGVSATRIDVLAEDAPPLRHLHDMLEVIGRSGVSDTVKARATAAITRLGEVEAGVHGCDIHHIHFHEVGAADTLVDVVGAFVLVEALGIDEVYVGTIPVGGGTVEIAHGRMGVPAPATAALLNGYAIVGGPEMRELTTPTGALLVGCLGAQQAGLPRMRVEAVGHGAGRMKLDHGPNVLRVVIGTAETGADGLAGHADEDKDRVVELQTNLDDVSGEVIGYALRRLRSAGALDAWTVSADFKKDRPGVVLHVLAPAADEAALVDVLFAETGTLGIRRTEMTRHVAGRGSVTVSVAGQDVSVKWGEWNGRRSLAPEYEEAARAAAAAGVPLREVMHEATEAARRLLEGGGGR